MNKLLKKYALISVIVLVSGYLFGQARISTYWFFPQKYSQRQYTTRFFVPREVISGFSNVFVFGNLEESEQNRQAAVFVFRPEPTMKILSDSSLWYLQGQMKIDSGFLLTGYTRAENGGSTGWIGFADDLGNIVWSKVLDFDYDNRLCCINVLDTFIIAAGRFFDQEGTANLQVLKFDHIGRLLDGKSFFIGYEFDPQKMIIDSGKVLIIGNASEQQEYPVIISLDNDLTLRKKNYISRQSGSKVFDIISTEQGYCIVGQKNGRPWLVFMDKDLNVKDEQVFASVFVEESFRTIRREGDEFLLVSLGITDNDEVYSRIWDISSDGYLQWVLPEMEGVSYLVSMQRYFKVLRSDGMHLTVEGYRRLWPVVWSKTLSFRRIDAIEQIFYAQGRLVVLSRYRDTLRVVWMSPSGQVYLEKDFGLLSQGQSFFASNGQNVYVLSVDKRGNKQLITLFPTGNQQIKSVGLNMSVKDFLVQKGYVFVGSDSSGKQIELLKTNAQMQVIWKQTFKQQDSSVGLKVVATEDGYTVLGQSFSNLDTGQHFLILHYTSNGQLVWGKNYLPSSYYSRIVAFRYRKGYYYILAAHGDYSILARLDRNGNLLWEKILTIEKPHDMVIAGNRIVVSSDYDHTVEISYYDLNGKDLHTKNYNGLLDDSRLTSTGYIYVLAMVELNGRKYPLVYKIK